MAAGWEAARPVTTGNAAVDAKHFIWQADSGMDE